MEELNKTSRILESLKTKVNNIKYLKSSKLGTINSIFEEIYTIETRLSIMNEKKYFENKDMFKLMNYEIMTQRRDIELIKNTLYTEKEIAQYGIEYDGSGSNAKLCIVMVILIIIIILLIPKN